MMNLYKKDNDIAGLYDVCDWLIKKYPSDVYDGSTSKGSQIIKSMIDLAKAIKKLKNEYSV